MSAADLRERAAAPTAERAGVLWGIIDCARDPSLYLDVQQLAGDATCLFTGRLDPVLLAASPYLVRLHEGAPLRERWRNEGWGQAWGIVFRSDAAPEALLRFLRNKMDAQLPDGKRVLFRFYDPRVFRDYLPICEPARLPDWFDLMSEYIVENEIGNATIIFRHEESSLRVATSNFR